MRLFARVGRALCRWEGKNGEPKHVPAPVWTDAVPNASRGVPPSYYCSRCGQWPVPAPVARVIDTRGRAQK